MTFPYNEPLEQWLTRIETRMGRWPWVAKAYQRVVVERLGMVRATAILAFLLAALLAAMLLLLLMAGMVGASVQWWTGLAG